MQCLACFRSLERESSLYVGLALGGEDVLAGGLEGVGDLLRGPADQIPDSVGHLQFLFTLHVSSELLLEGLSVDLGQLLGR